MPTPFQTAVAVGDVAKVREMLAAGEDPDQQDERGGFAIERAMACLRVMPLTQNSDEKLRNVSACITLVLEAGGLPDGPRPTGSGREPSRAERFEYLRTIEEAGGFKAYEKAHARALAATLAKKFPARIPEEIFPRVVAFWAHTGFYVSAAAVAANPRTQGRLKSR